MSRTPNLQIGNAKNPPPHANSGRRSVSRVMYPNQTQQTVGSRARPKRVQDKMEPSGSESQQSQLQPGRPRDRFKGQPSQIPSYKCRFPWPPSSLKRFLYNCIPCQVGIRSCNCNRYHLAPALPQHAHNRPRYLPIPDSFFCERFSSEGGGERQREKQERVLRGGLGLTLITILAELAQGKPSLFCLLPI